MKEQIKTSERELSDKEIDDLSDAEFKTLVIGVLTEMVEYGCKLEEKVRAMQSEIKENVQGINNDRKETRTQINDLDQKEERNIQPEQNEETRIQKGEERLRNLQDNFQYSNIQIIGVPEGEEQQQEIENLFEKNNEGELPQSDEGNTLPQSSGSSDSPKQVGPKEAHTKAHHNYITQD